MHYSQGWTTRAPGSLLFTHPAPVDLSAGHTPIRASRAMEPGQERLRGGGGQLQLRFPKREG